MYLLKKTGLCVACLFAAFSITVITALPAHAQTFTNEEIAEQKRVVLLEMVDTIEAHLNLLQMIFIQKLEREVAYLQAQVDAQSN